MDFAWPPWRIQTNSERKRGRRSPPQQLRFSHASCVREWIELRILLYPYPYMSTHVYVYDNMYHIFHSKFIVCRSLSSFLEDQHITSPYFVLLPSRTQTQIWKILRNPDDLDIYAIINVIFQRVSFWQLTSCTLYISISPIGYQCTIPSYSSQIPLYP